MALFKIFKGLSTDFTPERVPLHDGYAYFTPDDGKFYIDAVVNDVLTRVQVSGGGEGTVKSVNDITPDDLGNVGLTSIDIDDIWHGNIYDLHTILNENIDTYVFDTTWNTDADSVSITDSTLVLDSAHIYKNDALETDKINADGILVNIASKQYVDTKTANYPYQQISNKPTVNGITLEGTKSLYALGIQPLLGTNNLRTINGMSLLSSGDIQIEGTLNYLLLNNLPQINGIELTGNKTLEELGIHNFSGKYNDLTGKPKLKSIALTADYNDLLNKPQVSNFYLPNSNYIITCKGVAAAIGTLAAEGAYNILPNQTISSWYEVNGKVNINTQPIEITTSQVTDFPNYAASSTKGGDATSAEKVNHSLNITVGYVPQGSFDGSEDVSIEVNATTLGIGSAMHYIGVTATIPVSQTIILADGSTYHAHSGDIVICSENGLQYMSDGTTWSSLGEATNYATEDHVHGNISKLGLLTDISNHAVTNVLMRTDGTGKITEGVKIATTADNSLFLRNDGTWAHPFDFSVVNGRLCVTYTTE